MVVECKVFKSHWNQTAKKLFATNTNKNKSPKSDQKIGTQMLPPLLYRASFNIFQDANINQHNNEDK